MNALKTFGLACLFVLLCLLTLAVGFTFAVGVHFAFGGGSFGLLAGIAAAVTVGWAALPLLGAVVDA